MLLMMRDKEQQKIGQYAEKVSVIKKFRGVASDDMLISVVDGDEDMLQRIIRLIEDNPDWDNREIAEVIINEEE